MRVLLTGASGQVGTALLRSAPEHMQCHIPSRALLDLRDPASIRSAVASFRPELIINAAAYTQVDKAEAERDLAFAVNVDGPRHLAEAARGISDCRLIHLSTDYVFDGRASSAYKTGDATNPVNFYGRTKLLGERAVLESMRTRALVVRTAWVYASSGRNFLLTMLRLMREVGEVRVVNDQFGTPTAAGSVARALWRLAEMPHSAGILHWTDDGVASWYQFACAIAEDALAAGVLQHAPQVTPITAQEYPTPARRPARSVLDTMELAVLTGLKPTPWRESLRVTLSGMSAG